MEELGVTIQRQSFPHLIYHFVLTYSNWEAATVCFSESFESLSEGLQNALWALGKVPHRHRTDRLSTAVNNMSDPAEFLDLHDGHASVCLELAFNSLDDADVIRAICEGASSATDN